MRQIGMILRKSVWRKRAVSGRPWLPLTLLPLSGVAILVALLVLLEGPGAVWADSPPLAMYSAATGTFHEPAAPGWMATGENINDRLGVAVASAGDVNNDGYDDLVVVAGGYPGGVSRGRVYVYHGGPGGPDTIPERTLTGEADNDQFGFSVAGAGDVNGDGYGDLLVGAYQNDQGGNGAGKFYLYYGSAGGVGDIPAFTATGEQAGDSFGWRVAGAGDVNGDGYDDVLVTAPGYPAGSKAGRVYLFYGAASGLSSTAVISITGEANLQEFGNSAASAGDVNGDGYDDIIVGAYRNDDWGPTAGKVYLYYGSAAGLDVTTPTTIIGENPFDRFGYAVSTAGDVNGDGYADVLVGATDYALGSKKGKVYMYLGSAGGLTTIPAFMVEGEQDGDELGWSMDTAGDMNGDGYADILIGAPSFALNQVESPGRAYVYYGGPSALSSTPAITVTGAEDGDQLGFSVASAGDVNGDGQGDILIGANKYDNGGQPNDDVGIVYLYYGLSPADVAVSLWVDPVSGPAGSTVTYTIVYSNVGGIAATDVVITDIIPASLTVSQVYTSGAPLVETSSGNTYRWQLDSLAPQAGGRIILVAQVASGLQPGSQVDNTVEVATSAREITLMNNVSTVWFQVTGQSGSAVYLPLIQRGID